MSPSNLPPIVAFLHGKNQALCLIIRMSVKLLFLKYRIDKLALSLPYLFICLFLTSLSLIIFQWLRVLCTTIYFIIANMKWLLSVCNCMYLKFYFSFCSWFSANGMCPKWFSSGCTIVYILIFDNNLKCGRLLRHCLFLHFTSY